MSFPWIPLGYVFPSLAFRLKALLMQLPAEVKGNLACQSVLRKLDILSRFMKQVCKFIVQYFYEDGVCCASCINAG